MAWLVSINRAMAARTASNSCSISLRYAATTSRWRENSWTLLFRRGQFLLDRLFLLLGLGQGVVDQLLVARGRLDLIGQKGPLETHGAQENLVVAERPKRTCRPRPPVRPDRPWPRACRPEVRGQAVGRQHRLLLLVVKRGEDVAVVPRHDLVKASRAAWRRPSGRVRGR